MILIQRLEQRSPALAISTKSPRKSTTKSKRRPKTPRTSSTKKKKEQKEHKEPKEHKEKKRKGSHSPASNSKDKDKLQKAPTLSMDDRSPVGFHGKKGSCIKIDGEEQNVANYDSKNRVDDEWGEGVIFSKSMLTRDADGSCTFTFSVSWMNAGGQKDYFACGVTTTDPSTLASVPKTADLTTPSWLVGFDGATWANGEWGLSAINDSLFKLNDVVTMNITASGFLEIFVNALKSASHDFKIPKDQSLYAVLDLSGLVGGVTVSRGSQQNPQAAASLVAPAVRRTKK